jgi:FtsZ-interacting cell division protein YlmF
MERVQVVIVSTLLIYMGAFMKKLLGIFLVVAMSAFLNMSAMEDYEGEAYAEGAFPQDIAEQMRQEEQTRRFQQIEARRARQSQAAKIKRKTRPKINDMRGEQQDRRKRNKACQRLDF